MTRAALILLFFSSLLSCTTYRDQLVRAQHAFEQNQHEQTLGLLRDLEKDMSNLSMPEQAQYAYLRGMTDFRIGFRADARHWLALARAYDEATPGVLPTDWKARLGEALDELNVVVYDQGLAALTNTANAPQEDNSAPVATPPKAKTKQ
jgi:hypothetical protein